MKPIYYLLHRDPPVETSGYPSAIPTGFRHAETPKSRRDGRLVTPAVGRCHFNPAFFALALLLYASEATAQTTIRVRPTDNLQTVLNSAPNNSTLVVEAGNYGNITISKRVTMIGMGYFLQTGSQATLGTSVLGTVTFAPGSNNSLMTSFETGSITVNSSYVSIQKCRTGGINITNSGGSSPTANTQNTVKNCFVAGISIQDNTNFLLKGNILQGGISTYASNSTSIVSGVIYNNTLYSISNGLSSQASTITIKNNILDAMSTPANTAIDYNVFRSQPSFVVSTTNRVWVSSIPLYANPCTGSYQNPGCPHVLADNPIAKGAGEGGTDYGAFGGDEPYVLSGLPAGPIVYELSVPSQVSGTSTLNVRVKARVQN